MKKLASLLFTILSGYTLVAQPILTSDNFIPNTGDSQLFYVGEENTLANPTTGANVVFDYSGIAGDGSTRTQYVIDPTSTPFTSSFPSATHADTTSGLAVNKNYSKTVATDSLMNIGIVAEINTYGTIVVKYDQDSEKLMEFPFNYGMNFTDNYAGIFTLQSNSVTTNGSGSTTVSADGWGKLLLPLGVSIDSVLRVKTVEELVTDVINLTLPPVTIQPITIKAEYINYYKPSLSKFPLLTFISGSYTQDNNQLDSTKSILSQYPMNTVSTNDLDKIENSFSLFPNPSSADFTNLSFNLETNTSARINLTNSLGQHVLSIFDGELNKGKNNLKIKTSTLSKGIYLVNLNANNKKITKKLIIN